jgi:hypothetical protein
MLVGALAEAAGHFPYRLPEILAGYPRDETGFPVEYPTASRPQAWQARGATAPCSGCGVLGLDPSEDGLRAEPLRSHRRSAGSTCWMCRCGACGTTCAVAALS